eukprot:TRINITY_DN1098_c0_g1_i1.p1 TRINITY_DN1098_c0_g1~~TRINITY_DN1098_c0_g1_i1.p1  ORF type:complete len:214 (-),score=-3.88 TRINITY_DN1098_c0_g1_i1:18-659(-)
MLRNATMNLFVKYVDVEQKKDVISLPRACVKGKIVHTTFCYGFFSLLQYFFLLSRSLKYVHMSCLNIWRSKSSNSSNYYRCSECHAQYTHLTGLSYLYTVMPRIVYCINGRFMFSYICSIFIIGAIFWTIGSLSVMIDSDFETDNHILNSYFKGLFKRVWDGIFVLGSCVILVYVFNLTTSTLHQVYHKLVTDEPLNIRGVIFLVLMVCLMLI